MTDDLLRQELETKRRALRAIRLQLARYGGTPPVNLVIDEEDLAQEVRAIERELGIAPTPTIQERRSPRYAEPEAVFQERIAGQQLRNRQDDIRHQSNLLTIHRRNLHHLRAQMRELGAFAPPYIRNGVAEQIDAVARIKGILRDMGQIVPDLPGDE